MKINGMQAGVGKGKSAACRSAGRRCGSSSVQIAGERSNDEAHYLCGPLCRGFLDDRLQGRHGVFGSHTHQKPDRGIPASVRRLSCVDVQDILVNRSHPSTQTLSVVVRRLATSALSLAAAISTHPDWANFAAALPPRRVHIIGFFHLLYFRELCASLGTFKICLLLSHDEAASAYLVPVARRARNQLAASRS
jgi:hypothetical protein